VAKGLSSSMNKVCSACHRPHAPQSRSGLVSSRNDHRDQDRLGTYHIYMTTSLLLKSCYFSIDIMKGFECKGIVGPSGDRGPLPTSMFAEDEEMFASVSTGSVE